MAYMSTLAVVEEFYGEPISPGLLAKIRNTPLDQLLELADRLGNYGSKVNDLLETRIRHVDQRISVARLNGIPDTYDHFLGEDVFVHDRLILDGGYRRPVADIDEFKHLILYCGKILVPDLVLPWALGLVIESENGYPLQEENEGATLARFLRPLIQLAPLVRSGDLLLVPTADDLTVGGSPFSAASDLGYQDVYSYDPVVSWTVVNELGIAEPWELTARDLSEAELGEIAGYCISKLRADGEPTAEELRELADLVIGRIWPGTSAGMIRDMLGFSFLVRESAVIPVSSDSMTFQHLQRSGDLLLNNQTTSLGKWPREESILPAVKYRIPSLSHVSLDDLIRLRGNEEIFDELRMCLIGLTEKAAALPCDLGSQQYSITVRELAEDIVRPTWQRIDQMRRRASIRSLIWGAASAGAASLGISALGSVVGVPPHIGSKIGNSTANVVRSKVLRSRAKGIKDLEVAGSILLSLAEADWRQ